MLYMLLNCLAMLTVVIFGCAVVSAPMMCENGKFVLLRAVQPIRSSLGSRMRAISHVPKPGAYMRI